ncbi:hypothetical protein [Nocardia sp. NPDC004604]|uniref:hypothetical protein n=1 Tax=Nocardia sp. NPDC004604 TaxID=3157013 RepID=UPI0033A0A6CD
MRGDFSCSRSSTRPTRPLGWPLANFLYQPWKTPAVAVSCRWQHDDSVRDVNIAVGVAFSGRLRAIAIGVGPQPVNVAFPSAGDSDDHSTLRQSL